jgi:uncharacterized protein (TIRG00374 family)
MREGSWSFLKSLWRSPPLRSGMVRSRTARRTGTWRQLVLLLLFLAITTAVALGFSRPGEFARAFVSTSWFWMVVSALLFAGSFYLSALVFRLSLAAAQVRSRTLELLRPLMVSIFLNTAAPVGEAVFVDYAVERGESAARAAAGTILGLAVDLGTTIPFIAVGLGLLGASHSIPVYFVVVSALFVFVVALMLAALWLAKVRRSWLEAALRGIEHTFNWLVRLLKRETRGDSGWAARSAVQFGEAASSMARSPKLLVSATGAGLLFHGVNASGLYTLCLAFGQHVSLGIAIAAFSMSIVLYVVAVTPQGAGPTEGVMALLFADSGMGSAKAVAVAITYRIFNIWIPLLAGYLIARRMRIFGGNAVRRAMPVDEANSQS